MRRTAIAALVLMTATVTALATSAAFIMFNSGSVSGPANGTDPRFVTVPTVGPSTGVLGPDYRLWIWEDTNQPSASEAEYLDKLGDDTKGGYWLPEARGAISAARNPN